MHFTGDDPDYARLYASSNLQDLWEFERKYMAPLYGLSWKTRELKEHIIPDVAASKFHVLVIGETGTGKELVVQELAKAASLDKKLISINCAAIAPSIIESELFGYVQGAFTGAGKDKVGYLEAAHDGALFLDEFGELDQSLQAKLLRAIEQGVLFRVGTTDETRFRTRLFAATGKPENLRPDILWRFPEHIGVPPLRERRADIFAILNSALWQEKDRLGEDVDWTIDVATLVYLFNAPWKGNVRELLNMARTSIARYCDRPRSTDEDRRPATVRLECFPWMLWDAPTWNVKAAFSTWVQFDGHVRQIQGCAERVPDLRPFLGYSGADRLYEFQLGMGRAVPEVRAVPEMRMEAAIDLFLSIYGWHRDPKGKAMEPPEPARSLFARIEESVSECSRYLQMPSSVNSENVRAEGSEPEDIPQGLPQLVSFADMERKYYQDLRSYCPSLKYAAKVSGLKPNTLSQRLQRLGVKPYGHKQHKKSRPPEG